MTHSAAHAVASGVPYLIVQVADAVPSSLEQFLDDTRFVIVRGEAQSVVCGVGARHRQGVRVHEKGSDGAGKDTRTWLIQCDGDVFTAEATAEF